MSGIVRTLLGLLLPLLLLVPGSQAMAYFVPVDPKVSVDPCGRHPAAMNLLEEKLHCTPEEARVFDLERLRPVEAGFWDSSVPLGSESVLELFRRTFPEN